VLDLLSSDSSSKKLLRNLLSVEKQLLFSTRESFKERLKSSLQGRKSTYPVQQKRHLPIYLLTTALLENKNKWLIWV
jgi:hypothetical protein